MAGPPRSLLRQNSKSGARLGSGSDSASCSSGSAVRSIVTSAADDSSAVGDSRWLPSRPADPPRRDAGTAIVRHI